MKAKPSSGNSTILPLKLLFLSYLKNHQSNQTISDCHMAINDKINKISHQIDESYTEILEIVGD